MSERPGRGSDQFMLRLPDGVRDEIKETADANNRSMNAEIVARLTAPGMSLRDWFAGQAMAARIQALGAHYHASEAECLECKAETAKRAYEHADAMLAERAKP